AGHRIHQVTHEMFDPAGATTEVPLQAGTHHPPTKPRPPADSIVRIRDTQHVLLDEVHDLSVEGRLEPVGDMPRDFLPQMYGLLSDGRIKPHRLLDSVGRSLCSSDYFDERNDVWRIERMSNQHALGAFAFGLHHARGDAR